MKCSLCNRKAAVYYKFSKPLCKAHFKKQIEARVKKEFRRLNIIDKFKTRQIKEVVIIKKTDYTHFLIEKIVIPILEKSRIPYKICDKNSKANSKKRITISEMTSDDTALSMMKQLVKGKDICREKFNSPLINVLNSEAYIYKKLEENSKVFYNSKKILEIEKKLNSRKDKEDNILSEELVKIEEHHPGTKFSMVKSYEKICRAIKNKVNKEIK